MQPCVEPERVPSQRKDCQEILSEIPDGLWAKSKGYEKAEALPLSTSGQVAELIAMTRALKLSAEYTINIYSDSRWVVVMIHAHAVIYKEGGMVDSSKKKKMNS